MSLQTRLEAFAAEVGVDAAKIQLGIPGSIRQSMDARDISGGNLTGLASGRPMLVPVHYAAGDVITAINWIQGATAGASITHRWSALLNSTRTVVAVSNDTTANAITASTKFTDTLTAQYTIPSTGWYYHALVVVGTTVGTLAGHIGASASIITQVGFLWGTSSTTSLTTPSAIGTTYGAINIGVAGFPMTWSI